MKKSLLLALPFFLGIFLWLLPSPEGLSVEAWHLLSIFIATVVGVVVKPLPMAVVSLLGLTIAALTQTITMKEALSGFSHDVVWLIVFAFFLSRSFITTGLGSRVAYRILSCFGKHSLGLGYGLLCTDLLLAPAIPSVTARVGGIIYPILRSVAQIFTGKSDDPRMGAYLVQVTFQGAMVTSAMFITAMAGNPLIVALIRGQGIAISWGSWALAALVPGLVTLFLLPILLLRWISPTIRKTPHAKEMAKEKLRSLGPMKRDEWIVFGTFSLLLVLWIFGEKIQVSATLAAMVGGGILFATKILTWKEALEEGGAWDTFIWFSVLITLSGLLYQRGFGDWLSQVVTQSMGHLPWVGGFLLLSLLYVYSHYFFASCIAHIGAMYLPFLVFAIAIGTPPELAALALAFFSNLMGGLTHYGSGPAPILFGAAYLSTREWWKRGFQVSVLFLAVWLTVGSLWWKVLGLW